MLLINTSYDLIPEILSKILSLIVPCLLISLFKLKFNGLTSGFIESLESIYDPKIDEFTEKEFLFLLVFKYDILPFLLIRPI